MTSQTPEEKCCDKCYSTYTTDDYPDHQTLDACINRSCECHTPKEKTPCNGFGFELRYPNGLPDTTEIEEVVEDFVKGMWYVTGESQYPEGAEKKSYHQGFSDAVAMAYIELTGTPKSKGLIDKLLLSQQQKHREELQKARQDWKMASVEPVAKTIYNQMSYTEDGVKPEWVERGNSFKQDEARQLALKALDHSELDQDTELLNSVKEDWDKQAKNAMNGLDQDVSK